ncbi:MAG: sigma-70 family RNA polymerase sigma factor, partial [Planctomycetaceae bacterium]|nr:sigma-70 family RNA polymerase sigma factor [Planctomycetaceae bacterium]
NTIPSGSDFSLEDEILNKEHTSALSSHLNELSSKERLIIELRYGLNDGYQRSQRSISKIFNVSSERVRQIEAKALEKLRRAAESEAMLPEIG